MNVMYNSKTGIRNLIKTAGGWGLPVVLHRLWKDILKGVKMYQKYLLKILLMISMAVLVSCGASTPPNLPEITRPEGASIAQAVPTSTPGTEVAPSEPAEPTETTPATANQPTATGVKVTVYLPTVAAKATTKTPPSETPRVPGEFYVAPDGNANGDGSMNKPWDLQTALEYPNALNPGDTIWVRGGKYGKGGEFVFNSKLVGEEGHPFLVRAYPGERVVIDGGFMIYREWTTFWGFEVTNSDTKRQTSSSGSVPEDLRRAYGFSIFAPHVKLINNIVHDGAVGITTSKLALAPEVYGNISYNNGWMGPDRGHGYGIYAQNEEGVQNIHENIFFNNFGEYVVHVYGEQVQLKGFHFEGNVSFNGRFLLGGLQQAGDVSLLNNYFFRSRAIFGYRSEDNQGLTLNGNYFAADDGSSLEVKWWSDLNINNNLFWNKAEDAARIVYPDSLASMQWDNNHYYVPNNDAFVINESSRNWEQWKNGTGFDQSSQFTVGSPTGVEIIVRPNKYEAKRANIIIYNWDMADTVPVDLSAAGFKAGDGYVIHNVQNYFNETIEGTYDGQIIHLPMKGWTTTTPIGWGEPLAPTTFPHFGVFVVTGGG